MIGCGVDIGGTFTDAVITSPEGWWTGKADTTPERPSEGVLDAIKAAAAKRSWSLRDVVSRLDQLVLGSTIGTNAVVERKTDRAGLLTTHGFEDTLFIMRGGMGRTAGRRWDELGDPFALRKPRPLVARRDIRGLSERTLPDGAVLVPVRTDEVLAATRALVEQGARSVAVSFLWSCANPANEQAARDAIVAEFPELYVSCSSEVSSRRGEYERTVAAVINATLGPTNERLIRSLEDRFADEGFGGQLFFLTSSGGVLDRDGALESPLLLVGSGPAGGVAASTALAEALEHPNAILCDMGGTTFDVGLVWKQSPLRRSEDVIEGHTFHRPSADVVSIGAGGGSIAWADAAGGTPRLRVGPHSAAAVPGPACYGRGGTSATVTDANLVLGYIEAQNYFGPNSSLDERAARRALTELGARWGWDAEETAANVVRVVDAQMADLIRQMTVQRGFDPVRFRTYAFGGGGPLHIGGIAQQLGSGEMVIPSGSAASVFSAVGAATADIVRVFTATVASTSPWDEDVVAQPLADLWEEADRFARPFQMGETDQMTSFTALVGYSGQVHSLELPLEWYRNGDNSKELETGLSERFFAWYDERFGRGFSLRDRRTELRELRCTVRIPRPVSMDADEARPLEERGVVSRRVWWPEIPGWADTPVVPGSGLLTDGAVEGPAIALLERSAVLVHPGQRLFRSGPRTLTLVRDSLP